MRKPVFPNVPVLCLPLVLAAGCNCGQMDPALLAVVQVEPGVQATCILVEVVGPDGTALAQTGFPASEKDEYRVAIFQGDLPEEIQVRATAMWGAGCQDPLRPNSASALEPARFSREEVHTVPLAIARPDDALDADGDGFVGGEAGGPDCDDASALAFPGAPESCLTLEDLNCDGLAGCADLSCAEQACAELPSQLAFLTAAQTLQAGTCSEVVTLARLATDGEPTAAGGDLQVLLATQPLDGVDFFADPECAVPITGLVLTGASQGFHFSGTTAGTISLVASAMGPSPATQAATITPGPPFALAITSAAQTVAAGACSAPVWLEVRDAYDNPVPAGAQTTLSLAAAPGGGFGFFTDAGCNSPQTTLILPAQDTSASFHFQGTISGIVQVTASASGLLPADQNQTVLPADPARLRFATPAQTVPVHQCSNVLGVEVTDALDNPSPVTSATTIALTGTPAGGLTFYSDSGCTVEVTSVQVPPGEAVADFHFKYSALGQVTITVDSVPLQGASQVQTVDQAAATLAFTTAPQTRWAGECSGVVTVESRDVSGSPTPVEVETVVTLAAAPPGGFGFYSDLGCTTPISTVTLAQGQTTASFHFKGLNGAAVDMTASASQFMPAAQVATIHASRSFGSCEFTTGAAELTCAINPAVPDMNKTVLFYQATLSHGEARRVLTRCFLENASTIRCTRSSNFNELARVSWRTLYFPTGVTVRHLTSDCSSTGTVTDIGFSPNVNPNSSFVLFGMDYGANGYNNDVFATAELQANNNVRITRHGGTCANAPRYAVQVVQWDGASVTRGTTGGIPDGATSASVTGLGMVNTSRTFLLYTWRSNTGNMSGRMVRGEITSATGLGFERGASLADGVSALHWQRVQLPAGNVVQQVSLTATNNQDSAFGNITPVELTRSVIFSGGQSVGGTADGSGLQNNTRADNMMARFRFEDDSQVRARRARTENQASWNAFVIQFQP